MIDFAKVFSDFCSKNDIGICLSYEMPEGYETANGTFDPAVNTLFLNRESLLTLPDYEQLFYMYHELRHATRYLHPNQYDASVIKSCGYVILYDGTCYKRIDEKWAA